MPKRKPKLQARTPKVKSLPGGVSKKERHKYKSWTGAYRKENVTTQVRLKRAILRRTKPTGIPSRIGAQDRLFLDNRVAEVHVVVRDLLNGKKRERKIA
jgi:hypothetical protein